MYLANDLSTETDLTKEKLLTELKFQLNDNLMKKWYPLVIDKKSGGYYSDISYDWNVAGEQAKMVVTQSRHIYTTSKLAEFYRSDFYRETAEHGYQFLKKIMWDDKYGGFFHMRSREGKKSNVGNFEDEKRCYGNAFAIYALAALYRSTGNQEALELAQETFYWLEKKSFDKNKNGYFQFLTREGIPFDKKSEYKSRADDIPELGLKDQNSSIHLMEAYTELYHVWKDDGLKNQLNNLLELIRDRYTNKDGYLNLFFDNDLNPFKYKKSREEIVSDHRLDHVSFGHNYETAFLMLEASYALKIPNDKLTLSAAKKMLDHALANGWDDEKGGFYEAGYYFSDNCEIIQHTKNWWAQAEGLNALLLLYNIFPEEKIYYEKFLQLWEFVNEFIIDQKHGGWYWGSLDKEPHQKTAPKGTIWKAAYHDGRALMNCINLLSDEENGTKRLTEYWKKVAVIL